MISKRSFPNQMKFDLHQRIWLMLLLLGVDLVLIPVHFLIQLQNAESMGGEMTVNGVRMTAEQTILQQKISWTLELFSVQNIRVVLLLTAVAVIAALTGYQWLSDRRKVDFYHSLTLKRGELFRTAWIDGALIVLVPFLVSVLIGFFGVGSAHGVVNAQTCRVMGHMLIGDILIFLAAYAISIFAMVLTGRVLIGFLLSVMLLVYGPLTAVLNTMLMPQFFSSYVSRDADAPGYFASPATIVLVGAHDRKLSMGALVLLTIMTIGMTAAAYAVYRKRPSETAGNAYVHPLLQAVIKIAVAIPSAMVSGILFMQSSYERQNTWFAGGALIGVLAACIVMEAVQSVDLRNVYRHWKSGLLAVAGSGLIAVVLLLDPFGYDTYLPKEASVASIGLLSVDGSFNGMLQSGDYLYGSESGGIFQMLPYTETDDLQSVWPVIEAGVENERLAHNQSSVTASDVVQEQDADAMPVNVTVLYRLKSGRTKYRQYTIASSLLYEVTDALTKDAAYRENMYPVNHTEPDQFSVIRLENWIDAPGDDGTWADTDGETINLTEAERKALLEAMQIDLNGCSTAKMRNAVPIGTLTLQQQDEGGWVYYNGEIASDYLIYPMYDQTIAFLEGKGFTFRQGQKLSDAGTHAVAARVIIDEEQYELNNSRTIMNLLNCVEKRRWWNASKNVSITLDYSDGTEYNVDCVVKDEAALYQILDGREVNHEEGVG